MSGAGAGNGIGSGGVWLESPLAETADRPQQWSEVVRGVATAQFDAAITAPVALALNPPAVFDMTALRPEMVRDTAAFEDPRTGLTGPMLLPGSMPPVTESVETQQTGPAALNSPLAASATAPVALALNPPAAFDMTALRPGMAPDTAAFENLPADLTDPVSVPSSLPPVTALIRAQDTDLAALSSPLAASAGVPQGLAAALLAAGYGGSVSANTAPPAVARSPGTLGPAGGAVPIPTGSTVPPVGNQAGAPRLASQVIGRLNLPLSTTGTAAGAARLPTASNGGRSPTPTAGPIAGRANSVAAQAPPWTQAGSATPVPAVAASTRSGDAPAVTPSARPGDSAAPGPAAHSGSLSGLLTASALLVAAGLPPDAARVMLPPLTGGVVSDDGKVVAYSERRSVPIDLAPAVAEVPAWRLDDTQTLVTVGSAGPRAATLRAADLYRCLVDRQGGLDALRPDEGFATWEGSPLWLSLAAIRKSTALGVLAAYAPGRVQVMRAAGGDWLVEHAGGPWRAPRSLRHAAGAEDDAALLLDVLYGVAAAPESAVRDRFETASAALRFAHALSGPAGWRAQEAWAMVARCCAVAAAQSDGAASPLARATQIALAAVADGLVPVAASDCVGAEPIGQDRFVAAALSGNPHRLSAALGSIGRATLKRLSGGHIEGLGVVETLALAVWLRRLPHVASQAARAHAVDGGSP